MSPTGCQGAIHRREFLGAAGSAVLVSPLCARRVRAANDNVNVAFIGLGRRGSANFGHAAQVPGLRIAAVCDPHPAALQRAQASVKTHGIMGTKAHRDWEEILAESSIDAVCIAVPGALAPRITVEACQSGKDVYVELPLFAKLDHGRPILDAARQFHRVVQAGTTLRSGMAFQKAREIVRSGELGAVGFCRVTATNDPMPRIDLLHFLFDEPLPVSVDARTGTGGVHITFRYPAFIASYESLPGHWGGEAWGAAARGAAATGAEAWGIAIHGTRATLAVNQAGYRLFPGDHRRSAAEPDGRPLDRQPRGEPPPVAHWKNFLECIRTRQRPAGDIETCMRSTTACLRAGLAIRRNWVAS
jgi:predicted dehydrogenase